MRLVMTWITLGLLMMPLSESLAVEPSVESPAVPLRTTCHEGRCKIQHKPVNRRNFLKESPEKTLEKDKKSKSQLTQPPEPRGSIQKQQAHHSSVRLEQLNPDACQTFSKECRTRVDRLEQYRKEADSIIKTQEGQIAAEKEKKRSFPWVHVTISVLVGALTGVILL